MDKMDWGPSTAVLGVLVERLRAHGSWCGETHIQKACYFLNELSGRPLPFTHILYKHGPYSFDLCDKLTEMRANGLLTLEFQQPPYGPRYVCTDNGMAFIARFPRAVEQLDAQIERVAAFVGNRKVSDLERLATALYVIKTEHDLPAAARAGKIHELKPHIQESLAESALEEVLGLLDAA